MPNTGREPRLLAAWLLNPTEFMSYRIYVRYREYDRFTVVSRSQEELSLERANEVARQIEVLLTGLAKRAEDAGLTGLCERLREVAREAANETAKAGAKAVAKPMATPATAVAKNQTSAETHISPAENE
jgi:hypothetical protein